MKVGNKRKESGNIGEEKDIEIGGGEEKLKEKRRLKGEETRRNARKMLQKEM